VKIAYVVYPDFTALDLIGPYEVISRWPEADVHFVASKPDPVRCDRGLTVIPTDSPATLSDPDLIVVPGSENPVPVLDDSVLIEWLRTTAPNCQWTASVCTGAGLYAAASLLEGKKTTTHWGFRDNLKAMGVPRWSPTGWSGRATTSAAPAYPLASTWRSRPRSGCMAASWPSRYSW
jgi:putative intracellular protease/amidase